MSVLFSFSGQAGLGKELCKTHGFETGSWEWRYFPDKESYVRITSVVKEKAAIILCSLNEPDTKILALVFLARTLKELGATKITLIAPYLGYMRQDKRFKEGEAVTSDIFAKLLSPYIDYLITIDPHLHRHTKLEDIYKCQCTVLSASHLMASWISEKVKNPLLIGPDMESEQWVKQVAADIHAPYVILSKTRYGNHDVEITMPDISAHKGKTPVLPDDIISTAGTMLKTIELLHKQNYREIVCIATHAVFAPDAFENLQKIEGIKVVTSSTIPHPSNALDVASLFNRQIFDK